MIPRKFVVFIAIGAVILLACAAVAALFIEKKRTANQLSRAEELIQKLKQDMLTIKQEKQKSDDEKEKIQKDSIFYIELNTKLKQEKEELQKKLAEGQNIIELKEGEIERLKLGVKKIQSKSEKDLSEGRSKLAKQEKELTGKISSLQKTLRKEQALYNYNLGVSYTQTKMYDEAEEAYKKALQSDPAMAEACFNLGFLYENIEQDYQKAIMFYRRYLKLATDSSDRQEVEAIINRLESKLSKENQ